MEITINIDKETFLNLMTMKRYTGLSLEEQTQAFLKNKVAEHYQNLKGENKKLFDTLKGMEKSKYTKNT